MEKTTSSSPSGLQKKKPTQRRFPFLIIGQDGGLCAATGTMLVQFGLISSVLFQLDIPPKISTPGSKSGVFIFWTLFLPVKINVSFAMQNESYVGEQVKMMNNAREVLESVCWREGCSVWLTDLANCLIKEKVVYGWPIRSKLCCFVLCGSLGCNKYDSQNWEKKLPVLSSVLSLIYQSSCDRGATPVCMGSHLFVN